MNQLRQCNPVTNVVAAGIAILDLNPLLGTTLECLNLALGGTTFTKAMMTLIQLKANGKVIFETSGTNLDLSENYKNYATADATKLSINFMEPKAKTPNAFQSGAIDLSPDSGITNLRLEVTIAGATAPTLYAVAEVSPAVPVAGEEKIRFLIQRRHRNTQTIGAVGALVSLQVPHIEPSGGGSVFKRVFVYSAFMTGMKLVREGIADFETFKADHEWAQKKALKIPQTNLHVFDPILDGIQAGRCWDTRPANNVRMAQFYGTFSAGETITIETEELLPLSAY